MGRDGSASWRSGCGLRCGCIRARRARGGSLPGGCRVRGTAVQHGDLGPWNLLWGSDRQVVGVLDWELAGPASPLYDTGHLAWFIVPLMDNAREGPQVPAAAWPAGAAERVRQGHAAALGEVLGAVPHAQQEYTRRIVTTGSPSRQSGQVALQAWPTSGGLFSGSPAARKAR